MRSELHEVGVRFLATTKQAAQADDVLQPSAVDAALGDESAPIVLQRGSRREICSSAAAPDSARMAIDEAHPAASPAIAETSDGILLRQLSRQLSLLEVQQQQIRRLLEQTERRTIRPATAQ